MRSSRRTRARRVQAQAMMRGNLPRHWKILFRLPRGLRWILFFLPFERVAINAERDLARRHRRALRGDLMLPAKERSS